MIKLVASDVDGTLLPEGTADMDPELYEIIRKLQARGIVFVAASGRQMPSVKNVFVPVKDEIYFISNNGGYVTYGDEELVCNTFEQGLAREIIEYIRTIPGAFYLVTTPDSDYTDCQDTEMIERMKKGYRLSVSQVEDVMQKLDRLVKICLFLGDQDAAQVALPAKEIFGERAQVTAAGDHWVDFTALGSEKGHAITALQGRLGVTREETMAFGDNNNDIGMLLCAAESYAVAGARAEVKEAASHTLTPEQTVLDILRTLL